MSEKDSKSIGMTQAEIDASRQKIFGEQGLERVVGEGARTEVVSYPSDDNVVDGEFVETAGGGDENKKSKTLPKWEQTLEAAKSPGVKGRDALLESARRQAQAALDLEEDTTEMLRIAEAINAIGEELVPPISEAGKTGNGNTENGRTEIPADEKKLKLFLRERAREIIRTTSNDDALSLNNVRDKIISSLGFDPKTFTPVDLFARLPFDRRDDVRGEFEAEIFARCMLRSAELKEQSYKAMADKGAAVNRYMNDMKGSESGGASAAVLDRDTFLWLKNLKDEGDGLKRENIDSALAIFVMLGEREPDFSDAWAKPFEKFRPKKINTDGVESWGTNYYDPSYQRSLKAEAISKIEFTFGKDATSLAWQMFQAFKEEGNYNWQHYLSRDFTFAASRHSLATLLTPPVYIGSRRVYETKTGTYKDELERVALSALRVKTKVGEDPDPTPDDSTKTKDRLETNVYLERARRGTFLEGSPFEDQNMIKEGRMPQQLSYNTVKDGEKFRAAIVTVGELGKEADKGSKIGPAIGALSDLRTLGQSLVEVGVMTQEELDKQIEVEARNVIWELGIESPTNVQDLAVQVRGKQNFLTPSALNNLFQAMGGRTKEGYFLIGSNEAYQRLKGVTLRVRSRSWEIFEDLEGEEDAMADKEKHAKDFVELPNDRGNPLVDQIGKVNAFMTKKIAGPASKVISPLADILFPEVIFGKRKKR